MAFDDFWQNFRHPGPPRSRGDKQACKAIYEGRKKTKHGLEITEDMHPMLDEAALAHRGNTAECENKFLVTCEVWLNQHRWEVALEQARERKAKEKDPDYAEMQARVERRNATQRYQEAYSAWRLERNLLKSPETEAQFREYMRQKPRLRVVG